MFLLLGIRIRGRCCALIRRSLGVGEGFYGWFVVKLKLISSRIIFLFLHQRWNPWQTLSLRRVLNSIFFYLSIQCIGILPKFSLLAHRQRGSSFFEAYPSQFISICQFLELNLFAYLPINRSGIQLTFTTLQSITLYHQKLSSWGKEPMWYPFFSAPWSRKGHTCSFQSSIQHCLFLCPP